MSSKDYERIAAALKAEKPAKNWCPNKLGQWTLGVKAIAGVLEADSPRFDRERFYNACEMEQVL